MSKLGVGVGDEFPADEVRTDEDGVVHHYHYYRRDRPRRWRGGPFRLILWLMLIAALFRLMNYAFHPEGWGSHFHQWLWGADTAANPYLPLIGTAVVIGVIGFILWLTRCREDRSQG